MKNKRVGKGHKLTPTEVARRIKIINEGRMKVRPDSWKIIAERIGTHRSVVDYFVRDYIDNVDVADDFHNE